MGPLLPLIWRKEEEESGGEEDVVIGGMRSGIKRERIRLSEILGSKILLSILLLHQLHSFQSYWLAEKNSNSDTFGSSVVGLMGRTRPRIVLFGDSITELSFRNGGWGAALADYYSRKADIIVRGYGGYNTRWALFLLDHIFPKIGEQIPDAVTVFFGANDAALLGRTNEHQHVPIAEYGENLKKIIHHVKELNPSVVVVLITPPPIDEDGREEYARSIYGKDARELPERTNEMAGLYADHCVNVAAEMGVSSVNIWSKLQTIDGWQRKLLSDGLHLTKEGNAVVHEEVVKALVSEGLDVLKMPNDFPHHSEVDPNNPEKAFNQTTE